MPYKRNTFTKIVIATLFATLILSCVKEVRVMEAAADIAVRGLSEIATRGYVQGSELFATHSDSLHGVAGQQPRPLYLSAYLTPQSGRSYDYLVGERFEREEDGLWHRTPAAYWPLGGTLDMLAYSADEPFTGGDIIWGTGRCTDRLTLQVGSDRTQDDILYGSVFGCVAQDGVDGVPMVMRHAQAWIEIRLKMGSDALDGRMTVERIVIEDIYTDGTLEVTSPFGAAESRWSFRRSVRQDTAMDDRNGVTGRPLGSEEAYMDMLLPEQPMKALLLYYTYGNNPDVTMDYRIDLPDETWQSGYKYIYDITISPRGITFRPEVEPWSVNNIVI